MKISVLIPTKNEPLINDLIENIHQVLRNYNHEIIIIDKSDTSPQIKNAKLILQKSDGLGKAVLEGLEHASGDIIITMDGDFSHNPKDIIKLLDVSKNVDIVAGSRFIERGKSLDITHRKFISKLFRLIVHLILDITVKDSMSGFVAIKRKVYDKIKLNPIGYKINMEIFYKSKKFGFKIKEIPIVFQKRKYGRSKAGIKEGFRTLIFILKLRLGL